MRCLNEPRISWCTSVSLCVSWNSTSGFTKARRSNSRNICDISTESLFKNLRRAGTLKNKRFTIIHDPAAHATGSCDSTFDPEITMHEPNGSSESLRRVLNSTSETAQIEASASPLKPIVLSENKSLASLILDVECLSNARRASVGDIPQPLSTT